MKKILLLSCLLFGQLTTIWAQGKIQGRLIDKQKQAIEFATIILENKKDSTQKLGTSTTESGNFLLENIPFGNYKFKASFVGYKDKIIDSLNLSEIQPEINLKEFVLQEDAEEIKAIEIVAEKDLLEELPDRVVYNAEKDLTNAGGTAADVLRKAPMVSVDLDNNVQMRGSSNVRILINGKPSAMMANNVGEALRQIPADMIKKVEVITNPSAKYEAEGTAGIINIITKKKTLEGVNGSVSGAAGTRNSNLFSNISIKRKKIGSTFSFGGGAWYAPFRSEAERSNLLPTLSLLNQENNGRNFGFWSNGNWNNEIDLGSRDALTTNIRFSKGGYMSDALLQTNFSDGNGVSQQRFFRDTEQRSANGNADATIDYTRTFKDSRKDLSLIAQYSRGNNNNRYELFQNPFGNSVVDYQERNRNIALNQEWSFQTDFTQPLDSTKTIEVGARATLRNVNSDFRFDLFNFEEGTYLVLPERTNVFSYSQNVMAAYSVFSWNTKKKFGLKAGLRYEMTDIEGNFQAVDRPIMQNYDNLIPSITLSKNWSKLGQFRLSYSQRIQRPFISYLNPYVNYADNKNISFGNPDLQPELTRNYELGFSRFFKNVSFNTTLYHRNTTGVITTIRRVNEEGVSSSSYENFATNNTYGMSFFTSFQFLKKGRFSSNFNIFYLNLNNENEGIMYNGNLNISYRFEKGWSVQSFSIINSPRVELQGINGTWYYYNLGVRKEILKKKGGLTLGLDNPFANAMIIRSQFEAESFRSRNTTFQFNRGIRVSFNYSFGKVQTEERKPRRKKTLNNDDNKQAENQDNK